MELDSSPAYSPHELVIHPSRVVQLSVALRSSPVSVRIDDVTMQISFTKPARYDGCSYALSQQDILSVIRWLRDAFAHDAAPPTAPKRLPLTEQTHPLLTDGVVCRLIDYISDVKTAANMANTCSTWASAIMDENTATASKLWQRLLLQEFGVKVDAVHKKRASERCFSAKSAFASKEEDTPFPMLCVARTMYRSMAKYRAECFRAEMLRESAAQLQRIGLLPAAAQRIMMTQMGYSRVGGVGAVR